MALPNTYYRLDYIEANGNQYINTGLSCGNMNTYKMVFEMATTVAQYGDNYRFMMLNSNNRWVAIVPTSSTTYKLQIGGSGTEKTFTIDSVFNFHTITLDCVNSFGQIDDTQQSLTNSSGSINGNIIIFGQNNNGSYYSGGRTQLKKGQIYQNGTLVINFIPAMRKSDNVVGLYDEINDVFYTNAGSGTFTYGSIVYEVSVDINPLNSGSVLGVGTYTSGTQANLVANANGGYAFDFWELDGYTRLDYIESTGTQYIDTGLAPSYNLKALVKGRFTNNTGSQYAIGCYQATNINRFDVGLYNGSLQLNIGSYKDISNVDVLQTHTYILDAPNNCTYIDDTQYTGYTTQTGSNARNVLLFARWQSSITYYANFQAEVYQFWENGALIRDFIPVIRHSDGAIGLLDLVEMKFYGNSGTGTFIGGDVYAS